MPLLRLHPMLLLSLVGCYLPTAYGLRDDGILPPSGGTELTAHVSQFGDVMGVHPWAGLQGRWRLGERVGLRTNIATLVMPEVESSVLSLWNTEGDLLVGLAREPEQPVTVTLSGGVSLLALAGESFAVLPAAQAGVTVSRTVADTVHPFVGVRVNPLLGTAEPSAWLHAGGGVGWRPKLGRGVQGAFGLEGGWDHGFSSCAGLTGDDDGWILVSCDTWSVGVYGGVTLEGRKRAARREAAREADADVEPPI